MLRTISSSSTAVCRTTPACPALRAPDCRRHAAAVGRKTARGQRHKTTLAVLADKPPSNAKDRANSATQKNPPAAAHVQVIQGTPLRAAQLTAQYDAIVIGSGLSGLSAAAALAKFTGKRVLVLEQHYTAGGFTHAFSRGPYNWNVGLHYVGGGVGAPGGELFSMFNALTDGGVSWAALPPVYDRIMIGDRTYDWIAGREAWLDQMTTYFPQEHKALEQVLMLVDKVQPNISQWQLAKTLPPWLYPFAAPFTSKPWLDMATVSTAELFGHFTQDKELLAVLAGQYADIGLPPGQSSAGYQLMIMSHYMNGGYVPATGASSIAAALIPIIESTGGAVVTSADVSEVVVQAGRATGVKLATGQRITTDAVISSAGIINTYNRLLPASIQEHTSAIQHEVAAAKALGSSCSAVAMYIGVEGSTVAEFEGVGNIHKHHSENMDDDWDRFAADPTAPTPVIFFSCCDSREQLSFAGTDLSMKAAGADAKHQQYNNDKNSKAYSTLQLVVPAAYDFYERWSNTVWRKRGPDYNISKQLLKERLLRELGDVFPTLTGDRIAFSELSTPLSTEYFSRWPRGGMYGITHTPERYKARGGLGFGYRTPVQGLYLCGQDVMGCGVVPAFLTGYGCALAAGGLGVEVGMRHEKKKWE